MCCVFQKKKIVCSNAIGASVIKTNSLLSSFAQCSVRSLFHNSFFTKSVPGFDVRYCPSVCCNLSVSLCFSWFRKQFPERKKTTLLAASCSWHTSACALAASLDSSWFAGQYPDGRFITSNKSLAPCEHLRGVSDHVASFSFRKGSSNYLWILGFTRCFRQYFGLSFSVHSPAESDVAFVMSVCPCTRIAASLTGRVFLKFQIWDYVG